MLPNGITAITIILHCYHKRRPSIIGTIYTVRVPQVVIMWSRYMHTPSYSIVRILNYHVMCIYLDFVLQFAYPPHYIICYNVAYVMYTNEPITLRVLSLILHNNNILLAFGFSVFSLTVIILSRCDNITASRHTYFCIILYWRRRLLILPWTMFL